MDERSLLSEAVGLLLASQSAFALVPRGQASEGLDYLTTEIAAFIERVEGVD